MKNMNAKTGIMTVLALTAGLVLGSSVLAADDHADHDHAGHDHAEHDHAEHAKTDGAGHEEHAGHDHDDHGHGHEKLGGPNGGRMILDLEPHLEFRVKPNRHVEIRAFDHERRPVAFGEQWVQLIGGSRSKPTRMRFALEDDVLVSDVALPQGDSVPVVLRVRRSPAAPVQTIKFNVNLSDCPGCEFQEYACSCEH